MPDFGTPPTQNWGPSVNYKDYSYTAGSLSPAIAAVPFVIKDIATIVANAYSDLRLKSEIFYSFGDPVPWVDPDSYEDHGYYNPFNYYVPYSYGMNFSFTPVFQNLPALPVGSYSLQHKFTIQGLNGSGIWENIETYSYNTNMTVVSVVVDPSPTFSFTPATLSYEHQQNLALPSKSVAMTGNLWKIVGKPNFILSSATGGVTIATVGSGPTAYQTASGSGNAFIDIALSTFYNGTGEFAPTDLAGTFEVLQDNVFFGNITWTMTVVRLADFFTVPYPTGTKAFTLDQKYFEFTSNNAGTYFQFDAVIKTYDFFTDVENEFPIPQKVVLFQGKAKVNLGQIIHRLMRKFNTVNETLLQYKLATLNLSCSEILLADESIIRSGIAPEIQFVAGLSRGMTTVGFLDFNPKPNRVTKNSFIYLNILIPTTGTYILYSYKNGSPLPNFNLSSPSNSIICKKILFSDYQKGDVIDFYIFNATTGNRIDSTKKTFKLYPEGYYSNTIVWQNEFLLQSALECTGTASIKSDFEFISQKVWENLVEILEHLSSSKEVKLYINTGWLLKTDVDTIESLMRSKRAWLLNANGNISIRPIGKSMINQDLERELIEFSLEFTINRNYDEETYSL